MLSYIDCLAWLRLEFAKLFVVFVGTGSQELPRHFVPHLVLGESLLRREGPLPIDRWLLEL